MKQQSEMVRALRAQLAATEKELADQKWVFEQFLQSPAWRWTAPVRWVANRLRKLSNGNRPPAPPFVPYKTKESTDSDLEAAPDPKLVFTNLCQLSLDNFLESGATLVLPHAAQPLISIVLVLFNRAELTFACLRSIAENYTEALEVIIVDNASSDQTRQLLQRLRGARIISNPENRHFVAGARQGAAECCGENILFLNNDAQLLPGALLSALRTIQSSADIGAVGGKIILLDGTLQEAGSIVWKDGSCAGYGRGDEPFAPMYNFRRDVDYCSGAFLLTPRRVWEQLGGFDPTFEPAYYEETDYCMRLWERSMRVVYEPNAAIVHYEFASSQSRAHATALQARNQSAFAQRHRTALERQELRGDDAFLRARMHNAQDRVLFIDDRVPHPWLGSGFPRALAIQQALLRRGHFVTLYPITFFETWEEAYADFPHEIEIMMKMGREMLEPFLRIRKDYYSTIIVSRPHNMEVMAPYLKEHPDWFENVHVIYDAEAVFTEREIGRRQLAGIPMTDSEIYGALESEIQLTSLADSVLSVSENDRATFRRHGIEDVFVLGHPVEPAPNVMPFEEREGILFVGAVHEEKSPNADSLIWFLTEIFPKIRETLGDIPVTIAGVNKSDRIRALAVPPINITGHLPSVEDLFARARLFVAPTRYSAGIPIKVYEAAARGVPVVATPLLAGQLGWTDRELAIAADAESFAKKCIEVYTQASTWAMLRAAALERTRRECSPNAFDDALGRIMNASNSRTAKSRL